MDGTRIQGMMLELHGVGLGDRLHGCSLTVPAGQTGCIVGAAGAGKTLLLRAVLGLVPVSEGHISIDGELLTPQSAPYFRRMTAYVPQHLSVPEGYDGAGLEQWATLPADERYLLLLATAVSRQQPLLVVDEPPQPLGSEAAAKADTLLHDAARQGTTVLVARKHAGAWAAGGTSSPYLLEL